MRSPSGFWAATRLSYGRPVLENRHRPELEDDKLLRVAPGRAYSSVGEIRSAVGETDWHELEKERFAASIANRINKVALSGAFNQLVIVAPPKILGDLRHKFTRETETKIIAEVPKDLTHHTIAEIERLLTAE